MAVMQKILEDQLLQGDGDLFGIYRLRRSEDRFRKLDFLRGKGGEPSRELYALAYVGELPAGAGLDSIWKIFNIDHPDDYFCASLSVGDVVVLRRDTELSAHFVDSVGFTDLPDFFPSLPANGAHEPIKCLCCGKVQRYVDSELYCSRCNALARLLEDEFTLDSLAQNFWEGCFQCGAEIIAMIDLQEDNLVIQCDNCGETHVVPFSREDLVRYIRSGIVREMGAD